MATDVTRVGPTKGLDAEMLDMTLEAIQEFADRHLPADLVLRLDHEDECPVELVRKMCGDDLGIHLLFVPEEYGGMGAGSFDVCRVCEKMAAIDLGVATSVLATALGSDPIAVGAAADQQKLWLTRMAEEGLLFAYGATEPEAGSDLGALKTTATPIEQVGRVVGYRLNGRKQWISNGGIADAYTVLANTPGGPSWFVIERGAEGFTQANPEDKHGIRLSNTAALYLDDVPVDLEALVAVRQFQQQVLPSGLPPTTVWSYGSVNHPATLNYPAFTVEAGADAPVRVRWINGLVDGSGHFLPHLLPVDPTLHWANPPGGAKGRDSRPTFGATPGPYTGPVPMVTHLHGGHSTEESDGYPEA